MTIFSDIPAITRVNGYDQINCPAGAKLNIELSVITAAGTPQTMTGWTLAFVIRDIAAERLMLSKTTAAGITITDGSGTDDLAIAAIDAADTEGFEGVYSGAFWRTDGTYDAPLWAGKIVFTKVARQP